MTTQTTTVVENLAANMIARAAITSNPTDTLSRLASELSRAARVCDDFANDPMTVAYGAHDCMPLVAKGAMRRAHAAANRHGFATVDDAIAAIEARTSSRWVYFSGLNNLSAN